MKRSARARFSGLAFAALLLGAAAADGGTGLAIPVPTPPPAHRPDPVTPAPSAVLGDHLPFDSSLLVVIDDPISSTATASGGIVRAHLRDPLILGGVTVAPAGTPVQIRVLRAARAQSGDYYGFVDIAFLPLRLPNGEDLPLRAPTSHLTSYVSTGHEATVGVEDTVADIIFPLHTLYQAFRKGRNVTLGTGSILRARTVASVSLEGGVVVVATPKPLALPVDVPAASYRALPFAPLPTPVPKPTRSPTPSPESSPTSTPSASAAPLPSPT